MKKTPPKKKVKSTKKKTQKKSMFLPLNKSIINFKEKENDSEKLFCFCMKYYGNNFQGKKPYDINENEINEMGHIYYILNFNSYEKFLKSQNNNQNKYYSDVNGIVEYLNKNKKLCEEIFIDVGEEHELSQLAKEISEKINIISQQSDIIMESINDEIHPEENLKNNCFNKIKKENIKDNDLILLLKGKFVDGTNDKFFDIDNFPVLSQNLRGYELDENKAKRKEYFVQFKLAEKYLKQMKIRNDEKITNINYKNFEVIMNKINKGEEAIFSFLYNPIKYFDINRNSYKLGINECESVIFIDCSKNNIFLNYLFEQVKNYK
jgi:hypothetical protein